MEKTNIRRLTGVLMPFMIMVILQRLGLVLLEMTPLSATLRDLLAFAAASAGGIFFFRMSCGTETLRLRPNGDGDGNAVSESGTEGEGDDAGHIPPFPSPDTWFGTAMYTLVCFAGLIVSMHVVSVTADAQVIEAFEPGTLAVEFVALVLIHPFLEEYVFRWLYYRELRPMQPIFAGLAQAVMFAIVHGSVGGMIYALFAGVILVFGLERSGSLAVTVAAHMLVNLRSFVYLTVLSDTGVLAENAAHVRTVIDFCFVSAGFGAVLALMVRRGLREVWNNADAETEAEEETDDGE